MKFIFSLTLLVSAVCAYTQMDYFNAFLGTAPLGDADSDDISKYEN
jgi:hypothetical protein